MSCRSSASRTLQSLQAVIDHLEHDQCRPTAMLRDFDCRLLENGETSVRKTSLLSLFVLVRASMEIQKGAPLNIRLEAPIVIKDNLLFLKFTSGDTSRSDYIDPWITSTKSDPIFWGTTCLCIVRPAQLRHDARRRSHQQRQKSSAVGIHWVSTWPRHLQSSRGINSYVYLSQNNLPIFSTRKIYQSIKLAHFIYGQISTYWLTDRHYRSHLSGHFLPY